jgi:hypothetical protein
LLFCTKAYGLYVVVVGLLTKGPSPYCVLAHMPGVAACIRPPCGGRCTTRLCPLVVCFVLGRRCRCAGWCPSPCGGRAGVLTGTRWVPSSGGSKARCACGWLAGSRIPERLGVWFCWSSGWQNGSYRELPRLSHPVACRPRRRQSKLVQIVICDKLGHPLVDGLHGGIARPRSRRTSSGVDPLR